MFEKKTIHNVVFDFVLIENQLDLNNFVSLIKENSIIALDTEFTRRDTYYPILSIIQVALKNLDGSKTIAIIDVLQNINLNNFMDQINNPRIVKILHSPLQDLQIFYQLSKKYPQNIYDTQLMANFCEKDFNAGYSNLVKEIFNIEICKEMQSSNWQNRPLSINQIEYALIDVIFLHEIYEKFLEFLKNNNRFIWFEEEMAEFVNKALDENNKNLMRKICLRDKSKKQISQLNDLVNLREKFAQIKNVPREHLIKSEDLERIVKNPQDFNFKKLNLENFFVEEIKKILKNSKNFIDNSEDFFINENHKKTINKIKSLNAKISQEYNIKEQFLLNTNQIKKMVKESKIKGEINNWRYEILGQEIENIIKKI